jgi:hypothetical protein
MRVLLSGGCMKTCRFRVVARMFASLGTTIVCKRRNQHARALGNPVALGSPIKFVHQDSETLSVLLYADITFGLGSSCESSHVVSLGSEEQQHMLSNMQQLMSPRPYFRITTNTICSVIDCTTMLVRGKGHIRYPICLVRCVEQLCGVRLHSR